MESRIVFADEKVKEAFEKLKDPKIGDKNLYNWLIRAFEDLEKNSFCGIKIQKRLIPKYYIKKYGIDNLWKYNLPNAWRLLYSIRREQIIILTIILEWLDHKNYERRFGYGL